MKKAILITACSLLLSISGTAFAAVGTWTYNYPSSSYLDHGSAYLWGINTRLELSTVTSATISITGLNNSTEILLNSSNKLTGFDLDELFISLLDNDLKSTGISTLSDTTPSNVNYFQSTILLGEGINLTSFKDENATGTIGTKTYTNPSDNYSYNFTTTQLGKLLAYINDNGYIGIGLDPDCHYSYCGITLNIQGTEKTGGDQAVPEPATMALFGTGLVAFAGVARKRFQRK